MKLLIKTFAALLLVAGFTSCKEDVKKEASSNLHFQVNMQVDEESAELHDTLNLDTDYNLYVSLFQIYLSKITAINADGDETLLKDVVLVHAGDANKSSFTLNLPAGNFTKLRMGLGVDPVQNNSDVNGFPNEHPLSAYQGMYWSMLKYRFVVFEGVALSRDSTPNIPLAYHTGTDSLYQVVTFDTNISNTVLSYQLNLTIDLQKLFNGPAGKLDFRTQASTHSEPTSPEDYEVAYIFMENLKAAVELSIAPTQEE